MAFKTISELTPVYDSRDSFYGKAHMLEQGDGTIILRSYNTDVAEIGFDAEGEKQARVFGSYSATTLHHIKEFLRQSGFKAETKAQVMKDYGPKG